MATYTIFASDINYRVIESFDPTLAPVQNGTGYTSGGIGLKIDASYYFGFWLDSWYLSYQHFWEFDTTGIVGTIQSATISVYASTASVGSNADGQTHYVKLYDFGASVSTADYRTPSQFNALTNLANMTWPTLTTGGYTDFTSLAGLISSINRSGVTRMVTSTDLYAVGGAPTVKASSQIYTPGNAGTTNDPKLVIVTSAAGAAAMTEGADTAAGTATHPVIGASARTEGADTAAGTATHPVLGAGVVTEGADTTAATATHPVLGAGAVTEGGDTTVATAISTSFISAGMTEAADIVTGAIVNLVSAGVTTVEADDTVTSTGTVVTPPPHAQWDPVVKNVWVVLTNGGLTAHGTIPGGNNSTGIGDTTETVIGAGEKYYWEMHYDAGSSNGVGVATTAVSLYDGAYLGIDGEGLAYFDVGGVYMSNNLVTTLATYAAGDTISTAVVGGTAVWFRVNGGNWNNDPSANPATGVGGIAVPAGTIFPAYNVKDGEQWTANFGATLFDFGVPAGFSGFDELPAIIGHASITEDADVVTSAGKVETRKIFPGVPSGRPSSYPGLFADFGPKPNPKASPPPLRGASPPALKAAEPQVNRRAMPKINPDAWPKRDAHMHANRVLRRIYRKKKREEDDDDAAFLLL